MLTWPGWSKNSAWALRLRRRGAPARAKCLSGLLLAEPERQRLTDPGESLQGRLADRIRQKIFQCDAEDPAGRSKGSSCEAAPEGRTRGVLPVRTARRGLRPLPKPPTRTQCEPQDGHGLGPVRPRQAIRGCAGTAGARKGNTPTSGGEHWI